MFKRRDFLKLIGSMSVLVLTPLNKLANLFPVNLNNASVSTGELYAGFLLLPKDSPVPQFVVGAPCPILDYSPDENNPMVAAFRGITTSYDNFDNIKSVTQFPLYMPGLTADNLKFLDGYIIKITGTDKVWEVRCNYGLENGLGPQLKFSAKPLFPRPYPVWPVMDYFSTQNAYLNDEYPIIQPEKIDFTPSQGILLPFNQGYTIQWIKQDILYTLFIENQGDREFTEGVVKSLTEK